MVDGKMQRAEKRPLVPKDNTLMVALGQETYEFYSYNDNEVKKDDIKFNEKLEGWWNYIYFGYKRFG